METIPIDTSTSVAQLEQTLDSIIVESIELGKLAAKGDIDAQVQLVQKTRSLVARIQEGDQGARETLFELDKYFIDSYRAGVRYAEEIIFYRYEWLARSFIPKLERRDQDKIQDAYLYLWKAVKNWKESYGTPLSINIINYVLNGFSQDKTYKNAKKRQANLSSIFAKVGHDDKHEVIDLISSDSIVPDADLLYGNSFYKTNALDHTHNEDMINRVHCLIEQSGLSGSTKEVLMMYLLGATHEEISNTLGLKEINVKAFKSNAIKHLIDYNQAQKKVYTFLGGGECPYSDLRNQKRFYQQKKVFNVLRRHLERLRIPINYFPEFWITKYNLGPSNDSKENPPAYITINRFLAKDEKLTPGQYKNNGDIYQKIIDLASPQSFTYRLFRPKPTS